MLKSLAPTIALTMALTGIGAGAVMAQEQSATAIAPRESDPAYVAYERNLQASLEARMAARAALTGDRVDAVATLPLAPPPHWMAGDDAWRAHMRRCVKRYRTYDPATDLYVTQSGVEQRCKL